MREFDRGTRGWFLRKAVPGHGWGSTTAPGPVTLPRCNKTHFACACALPRPTDHPHASLKKPRGGGVCSLTQILTLRLVSMGHMCVCVCVYVCVYVCVCVCVCVCGRKNNIKEGGPHGSRAPSGRLRRQLEKDKKLQSRCVCVCVCVCDAQSCNTSKAFAIMHHHSTAMFALQQCLVFRPFAAFPPSLDDMKTMNSHPVPLPRPVCVCVCVCACGVHEGDRG